MGGEVPNACSLGCVERGDEGERRKREGGGREREVEGMVGEGEEGRRRGKGR